MVSNYYASGTSTGDKIGAGSYVQGTLKNFTQGSINSTGDWTDVALNGDGFFSVAQTAGSTTEYYTRDGNFRLNSDGYLVNTEGYQVLGINGNAIQVDTATYSDLYIDSTGEIFGTNKTSGVVESLGVTLKITQFDNQDGLIRQGSNLYTAGGNVGTATNNATGTVDALVKDSALEASNTDLSSEMVYLIIYQADYNANAKTISTANDMLSTVVNLIR